MTLHQPVLSQRGCFGFIQFCFHYKLVGGGWFRGLGGGVGGCLQVEFIHLFFVKCTIALGHQTCCEQTELEFLMLCPM